MPRYKYEIVARGRHVSQREWQTEIKRWTARTSTSSSRRRRRRREPIACRCRHQRRIAAPSAAGCQTACQKPIRLWPQLAVLNPSQMCYTGVSHRRQPVSVRARRYGELPIRAPTVGNPPCLPVRAPGGCLRLTNDGVTGSLLPSEVVWGNIWWEMDCVFLTPTAQSIWSEIWLKRNWRDLSVKIRNFKLWKMP